MSSVPVVILIPGVMGSRLRLGDEEIWPGPPSSLVLPFPKMDELMRWDLVAFDCIRRYALVKQYESLLDDLESWGFHEDGADGTLVVAYYDWRKDNAESAKVLASFVDHAVEVHGPNTEVTLLGHSQGGLISRFYLESGRFDSRLGFRHVRQLTALATPHWGAAVALPVVLGYERQLFLNAGQVLRLVSDSHYPAAYQLLPPSSQPFSWDSPVVSSIKPKNIFDPSVAQQLHLVPENLRAACEFRAGISADKPPAGVRYFSFAGSHELTTTHVMLDPLPPDGLEPVPVEMADSGDGIVPCWSGFLAGQQHMFIGGEHGTIYRNLELRRALAILLGQERRSVGASADVEVVVRERVVVPGDLMHVKIALSRSVPDFSGSLTAERAHFNEQTHEVSRFDEAVKLHHLQSKGMHVPEISLVTRAPSQAGIYRISFQSDLRTAGVQHDELIVQQAS